MESIFFLVAAGGVLLALISAFSSPTGGAHDLQRAFVRLGDLRGKPRSEIVSAVGAPNSVSAIPNGTLLQWIKPGYHIAVMFDEDDVCIGISHESAH